MKKSMYAAHSLDLINYLTIEKKHRIQKIEDSINDRTGKYKVCLFLDTKRLREDVDYYMENLSKGR